MFNLFIILFIAANVAFSLFDGMWMAISLYVAHYGYAIVFGAASFLHAHFCVLAWDKLTAKEEETPEE